MHGFIRLSPARRFAWLLLSAATWVPASADAAQFRRRPVAQDRDERKLAVYQQRHRELRTSFGEKLAKIAAYCDEQRLVKEAASLRHVAAAIGTARFANSPLPRNVQPEIARDQPPAQREWRVRYRKARGDAAVGLYRIALESMKAGYASYAYELLCESARFDSDNATVRGRLGYVRHGEKWVTAYEKFKADKGEVWHSRFGWLPKSHVASYEQGERYYVPRGGRRGTWIPAAKEAALRRDFRNAWQVRTEHYLVKTNHSLEEGVRVAKALEDFHAYFYQTFAAFFNGRQKKGRLFAAVGRAAAKPYDVHYYRTKDEYLAVLRPKFEQPSLKAQIAITNGMYLFTERICHFFHNSAADNTPTLYHEATHQVFYESLPKKDRLIAERQHFWIIEGISCYMESFKLTKSGVSLGAPEFPRFQAAKLRYENDRYYVPLERFTAMGREAFQTDRNIRRNYSQASGLAKFFMEYGDGKYRNALIEHLAQLYGDNSRRFVRVKSLDVLTGMSYKALDKEYGEFLRGLPARKTASK